MVRAVQSRTLDWREKGKLNSSHTRVCSLEVRRPSPLPVQTRTMSSGKSEPPAAWKAIKPYLNGGLSGYESL